MESILKGFKNSKVYEFINTKTGKKVIGTIFLSILGIVLPRVFHLLAGSSAGAKFLPMHIAVLIAGLSFGVISGSAVAGTSVICSYLLTGMPTLARLPYMLIELLVYAVLLGFLNKKYNSYISLIATIIIGRIIYAGVLFVSGNLLGFELTGIMSAWQATVTGAYGIALQLLIVPFFVTNLKKKIKLD